ncbi:CheY-like chemotaxis protein [Nakamurella sp. UYEF19]|uniref:response regulator n=1 Tax=Nakamurella sp. UYEF19 TaxID=1756392 RepID=UPI00339A5A4C
MTTRVLIVDDEPDQLGLLTTYFTRAGCTVLAVSSAEQALSLPLEMHLDLMVLDLLLPRINGWELTAHLRERYPGCPVAITSILDVEHYPQQAEARLPKPVTKAQVRDLLAENVPGWVSR